MRYATDNELEVAALCAEARRRGTSYGKLVARLGADEQKRIVREFVTARRAADAADAAGE